MRVVIPVCLALLTALEGALVAYVLTAVITDHLAERAGMSNFEGGRGYFAGLVVGPVGGVIGLVAGAIVGWQIGRRKATAGSCLFVVGAAGLTLAIACYAWSTA